MRIKNIVLPGLVVAILLLGGGYLTGRTTKNVKSPTNADGQQNRNFPLLSRQIFLDKPDDPIVNFSPLRINVNKYIKDNGLDGTLYFEYLPTGTSIRVGGDEEQVAASLMKIPVVMELYRAAELGRINIDQAITLKKEWLDSGYGSLYKKGEGYQLTLRDAAKLTLSASDNTAVAAIIGSTQGILKGSEDSLDSLDVAISRDKDQVILISARSYASFLKCLYHSCYNTNTDSQEIIEYLTKSIFNNRLRAGVPEAVLIAHKIGTYSNITQSDCGIIYEDKRNYVLCVMLRVPDDATGNQHIAALSKMVYDFVHTSRANSP